MGALSPSKPSSALNSFVGYLGGWLGWILITLGLVTLAPSLLLRLFPRTTTFPPWVLSLSSLPLWGGIIPLTLGIVCYIWGWGMLRYRAWAPFVAALFLGNVALYAWLFATLLIRQIIRPPAWMLADWHFYRTIVNVFVVAMVFLLGLFAFILLFGPGGLRTAYVERHKTQPPPLFKICAVCRSIITRPDGTCSWCVPRYAEARLTPVGAQPGAESVTLTFPEAQNRVMVGRRTPDRPPAQPGFVFLDPRVRSEYATISSLHAVFGFDYQSRQFWVEDQNSSNGTFLVQGQRRTRLPAMTPQPLADGDIIELGGARFVFQVVSTGN